METVTTNISAKIRSVNDKFEQTFGNGDSSGMAELYTHDGMLLPAGTDIIKGKQGIAGFWQGAMNMGIKQAKLTSLEVQQCENTAIETGNYTLMGEGNSVVDKGKYIVIWQKENGEWKLQKDIWNTSLSAT